MLLPFAGGELGCSMGLFLPGHPSPPPLGQAPRTFSPCVSFLESNVCSPRLQTWQPQLSGRLVPLPKLAAAWGRGVGGPDKAESRVLAAGQEKGGSPSAEFPPLYLAYQNKGIIKGWWWPRLNLRAVVVQGPSAQWAFQAAWRWRGLASSSDNKGGVEGRVPQ